MGYGKTVRDNIGPAIVGVILAQVGDGEGEGRGNEVDGVQHGQGQQKPEGESARPENNWRRTNLWNGLCCLNWAK